MKIKTKLLLFALFLCAALCVLIGVVYIEGSKTMYQIANEQGMANVEDEAEKVGLYFTGLINIGESASPAALTQIAPDGSANVAGLAAVMADLLARHKANDVMNIYIGVERTGDFVTGNGYVPPAGFDARKRPWYIDAAAARKTIVTAPYIDSETQKMVVSTGTPMYDKKGTLLGVIGTDIAIPQLEKMVKAAQVMNSGFGALIDPTGMYVVHADPDFVLKEHVNKTSAKISEELASVGRELMAGKHGFSDYRTATGEKRRMFYSPTTVGGYYVGIVFPHSQIRAVVMDITLPPIIGGFVTIIIVLGVLLFLIPTIVRPITGVVGALGRLAKLDLTVDPQLRWLETKSADKSETGLMIASMVQLREALTQATLSLRDTVNHLNDSAGKLDSLSQEASSEAKQTSSALDNVERLAITSQDAITNATRSVEEVSHAAHMTATSATEGAEASSSTASLSQEAVNQVDTFVKELSDVGSASRENSESIAKVGASVASIAEFVTTIRNIASQTNLLALNAAIEAARAGEAGRGFAVVADEVRKLAEESNVASHHVSDLMETLQNGTESSIEATQQAAGVIDDIIAKAQATQTGLRNALQEIGRVNDSMQTIAAAAEEQAASSNEISHSVGLVASGNSEVVEQISAVSKTTQHTTDITMSVADEANALSGIAQNLIDLMANFTLDENKPQNLKALPRRTSSR